MKINRFQSLRIAGRKWKFDWNYHGKMLAWCDPEQRLIQINLRKHKTVAELVDTLTREITHAVDIDLAHRKVYAIGSAVKRALQEGGIVCG